LPKPLADDSAITVAIIKPINIADSRIGTVEKSSIFLVGVLARGHFKTSSGLRQKSDLSSNQIIGRASKKLQQAIETTVSVG